MNSTLATMITAGLVSGALASTAHAQPQYGGAPGATGGAGTLGSEPRHTGFFFRTFIGGAFTSLKATDAGSSIEIADSGAMFGVALGGALRPGLILYGEVFVDVAVGPTITIDGQDVGSTGSNISAGVIGGGIGIASYFASNFFVSGTVASTKIKITAEDESNALFESRQGLGLSGMVGKE
jgi:hypothetical protein